LYWNLSLSTEYEGLEKAASEEGGEWESIKISQKNLSYVQKFIRHASLLTRSRPHSY
jgi:hypothetical protein